MLTAHHHRALQVIHTQITDTGISPSYRELKDELGYSSISRVSRVLVALEERGFIRRLPMRARAIEVLKLPASMTKVCPRCGRTS